MALNVGPNIRNALALVMFGVVCNWSSNLLEVWRARAVDDPWRLELGDGRAGQELRGLFAGERWGSAAGWFVRKHYSTLARIATRNDTQKMRDAPAIDELD
jgi:hypothetical protein